MSTNPSSPVWQTASAYLISSKWVKPQRSYDVISIFQDGGHDIAHLLLVVDLVMEHVCKGQQVSAYHISIRYLTGPAVHTTYSL